MNIAIFFSGRLHTSSHTESFQHFIDLKNSLSNCNLHFFASLNQEITKKEFVESFCKNVSIPFDEEHFTIFPTACPEIIYKQRTDFKVRYYPVWSMYTHNQSAFRLIETFEQKHNLKFDLVIKYRPDIYSQTPIHIPYPIEPNTIYVPTGSDWGGLNDQIGLGDRDTMKKYCDCIDHILDLCKKGVIYNPEILLKEYIESISVNVKRFHFPYLLFKNRSMSDKLQRIRDQLNR
jgi:hypothetical protein